MANYIKRTDVMNICEKYSEHCFHSNDSRGQDIADRILDDVVEIPSADVEEVVRCKDCKYYTSKGTCTCDQWLFDDVNIDVMLNDFCSYGERVTDINVGSK